MLLRFQPTTPRRQAWMIGCGVLLIGLLTAPATGQDNPFGGGGAPAGQNPFGGGQGDNPFGGGAAGGNPFGGGAAADADAPLAAAPDPAGPAPLATENDPVLLAIQETNPQTPEELLRAARWLIQLGRFDDARSFLKRIIDGRPERDVLFELQRKFGVSLFVRLRHDPQLAPEGDELGRAVLIASDERVRSPEYLQQLTERLLAADQREAAVVDLRDGGTDAVAYLLGALADPARANLREAITWALPRLGEHAIPPLLAALQAEHPTASLDAARALGGFRRIDTAAYLIPTALSPDSDTARRDAFAAALRDILGGLPSRESAVRHVRQRIQGFLQGDRPLGAETASPGSPDEQAVTAWTWDQKNQRCERLQTDLQDLRWMHAATLAEGLLPLSERPDDERLCRIALLGGADVRARQGAAVPTGPWAEMPAEALHDLLRHALQQDQIPALLSALRLAGERGDVEWLQGSQGRPSTLVQASMHANPEVAYAALNAIMQLDAGYAYAGSSQVLDAIRQLIFVGSVPRVLVGDPRTLGGQNLVTLFAQEGFEGDWAPTGKRLFEMAAARGDYDLVLISDILDDPSFEQVLQWLRKDPRTSGLRVALLARSDAEVNPLHRQREELRRERLRIHDNQAKAALTLYRKPTPLEAWSDSQLTEGERDQLRRREEARQQGDDLDDSPPPAQPVRKRWRPQEDVLLDYSGLAQAEAWAEEDPLTWAFPRPHSPESVAWIVAETTADDRHWPDVRTRLARGNQALQWLNELAEQGRGDVYDLFRCEESVLLAAWRPPFTTAAIPVLAQLGSPKCQRTLVNLASDAGLSQEVRLAALQGLRDAMARRGLLLTKEELLAQYDRYNASQSQSEESRAILLQVLQAIEEPTRDGSP